MGNDGGSIPTRRELVKEKKKQPQRDKDLELRTRWLLCALTQLQLQLPIVACELGRLFKKESILELLVDRSKFAASTIEQFDHIKSMKDVHVLKVTPISKNGASSSENSNETVAEFCCPISHLEMNGKYKFVYPVSCGCVFSERALKELLPKESLEMPCPVCNTLFNYQQDIVMLNPEPGVELDEQKKNMERRKILRQQKFKKAKDASSKRVLDEKQLASETAKKCKSENSSVTCSSAPSGSVVKPKVAS